MTSSKRTSAKIDETARKRLPVLSAQVQSEFGVEATHEAIVSALVLDISVAQLAGILIGYKKATAPKLPGDASA